jgi:hypothetical protein
MTEPVQDGLFAIEPEASVEPAPGPFAAVLVHFAEPEDRRAFEELIGQRLQATGPSEVWYPKMSVDDYAERWRR